MSIAVGLRRSRRVFTHNSFECVSQFLCSQPFHAHLITFPTHSRWLKISSWKKRVAKKNNNNLILIIILIIPWLFGCCFASSSFGRCCVVPYPSSWCCLPSPSLSEAASSLSSVWWCFISSPSSLGGAAFSPSFAGRYCLTFSFFGWCFGWGYFSLLFCWVVPLGLPLWVVVLRLAISSFAWCCLPSPPSLGGSLSREKSKNRKNKEEKLKSEFLIPIPDEKVHLSAAPAPPSHPGGN